MMWTYDTHNPYRGALGGPTFDLSSLPVALIAERDHRRQASEATGPERAEQLRRYLASLWRADRLIGDFYAELQRQGLADSTLFIVTGDHGEAFGQHGWFSHGHALFEEDVRVPLLFVLPTLPGHGTRSAAVCSHIDLWPTVAELLGLAPDPRWQGRSLFASTGERRAYFSRPGALGLRDGRFKYIWDFINGRERLFDLSADPGEIRDIASLEPDLCRRARSRLRSFTVFQSHLTDERANVPGP